jgi:hypothetical protein
LGSGNRLEVEKQSLRTGNNPTATLLKLVTPLLCLVSDVLLCWLQISVLFAASGDQAAGLAEALAIVACEQGPAAEAFAAAFAEALSQAAPRSDGCVVLTAANASTYCSSGSAFADANSTFSKVSHRTVSDDENRANDL